MVLRVVLASLIAFVMLYAIGYAAIFGTGCTEPGQCSFVGEVARDHGGEIVIGGTVLAATVAAVTRRRPVRKGVQ